MKLQINNPKLIDIATDLLYNQIIYTIENDLQSISDCITFKQIVKQATKQVSKKILDKCQCESCIETCYIIDFLNNQIQYDN